MKLTIAILAFLAGAMFADVSRPLEPQCDTDSTCAALCPADDDDCDGGPQP